MLNTLIYTEPSSAMVSKHDIRSRLKEPLWALVSGSGEESDQENVWYDHDGVFLSVRKEDVDSIATALQFIKQENERMLLRQYFEHCSDFEIVEYNNDREIAEGCRFAAFVGRKENPLRQPAEFFAVIFLFSTNHTMTMSPTVLTLWSQEDKRDMGAREDYLLRKSDVDTNVNPYNKAHDDLFVFHALSKLRRRMDSLIRSIALIR